MRPMATRRRKFRSSLNTRLQPPAGMNRDDAARQIGIGDAFEAYRRHAFDQFGLRREFADALGEVLIGVAVVRDHPAEERQHRKGIAIIEFRERWDRDLAEFKAVESPARLEHPPRFR